MEMTKDQQLAKKEINYWLLSEEPEHILSGLGGSGKSWLVDLIISELDILEQKGKILNINTITSAEVTATTNKAAGVLNNAITIQKKLKLRMSYNYKTGKMFMCKTNRSETLYNTLLVVDECSMVDTALLKNIRSLTVDCKVLFVGDHAQLLPVNEGTSPVFDSDISTSYLQEPVRCKIPDVFALCTQLRESVETGIFKPIQASKNIHFVGGQLAAETMQTLFHADLEPDEAKIITYTNAQAIEYDKYIRDYLGKGEDWNIGDLVLMNNSIKSGKGTFTHIGASHNIKDISPTMSYMGIDYRLINLGSIVVSVPVDWTQYSRKLKALAKKADWQTYFDLSETFADLRFAYASTAHSAQGSSYGIVFINLTELCKCKVADTFARLLYVAVSRSKYKVYFTGKLSKQYGG